jgi:hypothetical protein
MHCRISDTRQDALIGNGTRLGAVMVCTDQSGLLMRKTTYRHTHTHTHTHTRRGSCSISSISACVCVREESFRKPSNLPLRSVKQINEFILNLKWTVYIKHDLEDETCCLVDINIDRIVLKWVSHKWGVKLWTGFSWFRIQSRGGLLWTV